MPPISSIYSSPNSMSDTSLFETCGAEVTEGAYSGVLECVSDRLEERAALQASDLVSWLLVLAGALIFFMQAGFAMLCGGCVRKKNLQNTMLKNLLDACGAAIAFYCVGYAFAFGGQNNRTDITFIGNTNFFSMGEVDQAFWFFEYAFSATSVTIVAGTLAERCQMVAYLCYSLFLTGLVYPVVAHSIWSNNGFLSAFSADPLWGIGCIDFAGSGVVHLTGGTTALIATYILGARKGRFYDSRGRELPKPMPFPGHSMALQLMGTMILWFGWYGFNPGSALLLTAAESTGKVAALAAVNTSLAAASGAVGALFANLYIEERLTGEYSFDLAVAMNGTLAGLVAVTAPCGTIETWAAICVGLVAGWIYLMGSKLLIKLKLDDAVDAIPVHMFNGMWGLIATGLFSSPGRMVDAFGTDEHVGLFYSLGQGGRSFDGTLLLIQFIALLFVIGWSIGLMLPFFLWLNYMGWFRSDSLEELVGLDMSYHGGTKEANDTATPDDVKAYSSRKNAMRRRPAEQEDVQDRDEESWDNMTLPSPSETAPERRSAAIAADGTDADDMSSDADAEDMTS